MHCAKNSHQSASNITIIIFAVDDDISHDNEDDEHNEHNDIRVDEHDEDKDNDNPVIIFFSSSSLGTLPALLLQLYLRFFFNIIIILINNQHPYYGNHKILKLKVKFNVPPSNFWIRWWHQPGADLY